MFYQTTFPNDINVGDYIEFESDYKKYANFGSEKGCMDITVYRNKTTTNTTTKTLYKTQEHTINSINQFDNPGRPTLFYSKANQTVGTILGSNTSTFGAWDAYILKKKMTIML